MDTAVFHQLLNVFEYTYIYSLKNAFTGYPSIPTIGLINHLYRHYARISETDLAVNGACFRDQYNPDEPLECLYMNLNKCADYMTAERKPITEDQIYIIAYSLV